MRDEINADFQIDGTDLTNFVNLDDDDRDEVLAWRNHEMVRQWMYDDRLIPADEHAAFLEGLAKNDKNAFWMFSSPEKGPMGVGSLRHVNHRFRNAEMEIYLNPDNANPGIGHQIASALIKLSFQKLGFHKLYAETLEPNKKIQFLLYYIGFKKEGVLKELVQRDGKWISVVMMGLINPDDDA